VAWRAGGKSMSGHAIVGVSVVIVGGSPVM